MIDAKEAVFINRMGEFEFGIFFKVSHKNHLQGPKNETLFCPVFVPVYFDKNTQNIENQYFGHRGPTWA